MAEVCHILTPAQSVQVEVAPPEEKETEECLVVRNPAKPLNCAESAASFVPFNI